jgi:glycerophosphoryl diester phosphodiesterase
MNTIRLSPSYRVSFLTLWIGSSLLFAVFVILSNVHDAQAWKRGSNIFDKHKFRTPFQTSRPYNIAHRGANGQLPEETAPAYMRAIEVGADFIETDISATKDGFLVCMHDVTLDATTDVLNHTEFKDRVRTYEVEGANMTGIFTVDLTLAEIKTLRCVQRWPFRDHSYDGMFQVITFEEYIAIALDAPRVAGIYPEIKDPVFVNKHVKWPGGKRFEDIFMETLLRFGYNGKYLSKEWLAQPIFIQSFAPTSLIYVSNVTTSPLIFLIDDITVRTQDTNQTYEEITSDAYLDYMSKYIAGIGPWKDTIVPPKNNYLEQPTDLIQRAHLRGLQVHPYTFRNENQFLHWDFVQDPYQEYEFWFGFMQVDGVFTDFAQSLNMYLNWVSPLK